MKYLFAVICAFAVGVLVRDQAEDYMPKKKPQPPQIVVTPPMLLPPIQCDATVEYKDQYGKWRSKCYIKGMRT